jgi:hypothetical protein
VSLRLGQKVQKVLRPNRLNKTITKYPRPSPDGYVALICRWFEKPTTCLDKEALSGTRQRNIFWIISLFIAAAKICPISRAMSKSRDIASQARTSIAHEGSSISLVRSLPRCRIIIAKLAKGRATGWDTSFCSRTGAMPIEHGVGIVLPLTSTVWRPEPLAEIIRRKLMPSLEHVTWRDPTVTPTRLAISSRLIPAATNPLIFSIACGVNLTRLPLAGGLGFVIVMAAPLEVAEAIRPSIEVTAAANQAPINEKRDFHFLDNFARPALFNVSGII